jgi:hypothetical protein
MDVVKENSLRLIVAYLSRKNLVNHVYTDDPGGYYETCG